jgi:hypothetical protein
LGWIRVARPPETSGGEITGSAKKHAIRLCAADPVILPSAWSCPV